MKKGWYSTEWLISRMLYLHQIGIKASKRSDVFVGRDITSDMWIHNRCKNGVVEIMYVKIS